MTKSTLELQLIANKMFDDHSKVELFYIMKCLRERIDRDNRINSPSETEVKDFINELALANKISASDVLKLLTDNIIDLSLSKIDPKDVMGLPTNSFVVPPLKMGKDTHAE